MNSLKILDVTLRDGGCVNNFEFGQRRIERIIDSLEAAGVEYIEVGYIDQKNGSKSDRTQYCDEQVISDRILKNKKPGVIYVAMIDYGKYDIEKLQPYDGRGIDGIRMAFHKKDCRKIVEVGRKILDKGYRFFVQPMITLRYSDKELLELIEMVNAELPEASAFYIVDSFGEMRSNDMNRIINLVDHNLIPSMALGFHSHNNLQMSYSNALSLLQFPTKRDIMLDCSVLGMGKGAGNLNTELILEHLNLYYGKNYCVASLLGLIDCELSKIRAEYYWGYSVEYYLSAINRCTPSYAGHFYNKHMLPIDQVAELLGMIHEDKKISFDKEYAEQLYYEYNARKKSDDSSVLEKLKTTFADKCVVLIAPGKSILNAEERIRNEICKENTVSVSLNCMDKFDTDFVFATRREVFNQALLSKAQVITNSSVCDLQREGILVVDYQKWAIVEDEVRDAAGIMMVNLLLACGASELKLAGFDGFHVNISKNYYDKSMCHPISVEQAEKRNRYYKSYFQRVGKRIPIMFMTESLYEDK